MISCADGVIRRVFPRIFTYSADYPEKYVMHTLQIKSSHFTPRTLIANIRDLGNRPCPRCLVKKDQLDQTGKPADIRTRRLLRDPEKHEIKVRSARELLFSKGTVLGSVKIERLLKPQSLVPTLVCYTSCRSVRKLT